MKKELIIVALFIFSISCVLALPELSIPDSVQPGETILGQIAGNFARSLSLSDLSFYEGEKQIFLESDMIFYNGTYYFYAYPVKQGNFTLKVKNVLYRAPELKSINLEKNFEVKKVIKTKDNNTFSEILSIKPGFILTAANSKAILSNKGNSSLDIEYTFDNLTQKINLSSEDFIEIPLSPKNDFSILSINTYQKFEVPIFFTDLKNQSNHSTSARELSIIPSFLKLSINKYQNQSKELIFINPDESEISNFSFNEGSGLILLENPLPITRNKTFSVSLLISGNLLGAFNTTAQFIYLQDNLTKNLSIPVEIYVFSENSTLPDNYSGNSSYQAPSCSELGGNVCTTGICSGTGTYSLEGYCCIGQCSVQQPGAQGSSYSWIIGISILLAVLAGGFFVYKKYKNTKPVKADDALKEKSKIYEKRITGDLTRT